MAKKGLETEYVKSLKADLREKNKKLLGAFKALQEKTAYLDNILRSATEYAIATTDLDFRITYYNPMAEKLHGYKAEEVIGKTVMEVHTREKVEPERFEQAIEDIKRSGAHCYVIEKKTGEGSRIIEAKVSGIYGPDGNLTGYANFSKDVTLQKKAEQELRQAKENAEEATALKEKFVSLVVHDLKIPLTSILGFLNFLLADATQPLAKKHVEIIERVRMEGERIQKMAQELLDISGLKTGKIKSNPRFFNGATFVRDVIRNLEQPANQKGIRLIDDVPEGLRLFADPKLFSQVIQNLAFNAIKFSNKGDSVALFVPQEEPSTIAVRDTGVGIPMELQADLFKYEEMTTTTGTAGEKGTGFGLPLSQDIMKAHGGTLKFESAPGKGSVFYARLPHIRPMILIVDDEKETRFLLQNQLKRLEPIILEAEDGKDALCALSENIPHLIIADILMPGMDGFDLLENIRRSPSLKNIPVILLTADQKEETRDKAFRLKANDFVTKPIASEDLVPRVKRYLG